MATPVNNKINMHSSIQMQMVIFDAVVQDFHVFVTAFSGPVSW